MAQCGSQGPHKRETLGSKSEKMVRGGRPMNQGMRTALEAGKDKESRFSSEHTGGTGSINTLNLAQ